MKKIKGVRWLGWTHGVNFWASTLWAMAIMFYWTLALDLNSFYFPMVITFLFLGKLHDDFNRSLKSSGWLP